MAISLTVSYIFLIVIAVGLLGLTIYSALYYLVYYADVNEKWKTLMPRILLIIALVVVIFTPLVIPLDVSVAYLSPELTFMDIVWQVITYLNFALAFVVLPYAQFATEARVTDEKSCVKSHFSALWQTLLVVIVLILLSLILWLTIGKAFVPIRSHNGVVHMPSSKQGYFTESIVAMLEFQFQEISAPKKIELQIKMSYLSYLIAFVSFLGSFLFLIFTGIGLAALPIDYIKVFANRPKQMSVNQLTLFKRKYSKAALKIIEEIDDVYQKLISVKQRHVVSQYIKVLDYKRAFSGQYRLARRAAQLEIQAQELNQRYQEIIAMNCKKTANPLKYYMYLILGVLASLFSLLMLVQVCFLIVWQLKPGLLWHQPEAAFFLATVLYKSQEATGVPLLSAILFALIAFYLICCFLKGISKFGFRFILFVSIHPMRKGATQITSFLFNCILALIGTIASLNFMTTLFDQFTLGSAVSVLFNRTVGNIAYLTYWFQWYWIIFGCIIVASCILSLVVKSQDAADVIYNESDRIREDARQIKTQQKIRKMQNYARTKENKKILKEMKSVKQANE